MIPSNDNPLYTSQKEAVISEPSETKIISPDKSGQVENVNQKTDTGNGMYILKPDINVKTEFKPSPLFVDRDKLVKRFPDKAAQILADIENKNPLPDEVAQTLVKENIIFNDLPAKIKKVTKSVLTNVVNTIYNLIFS
jgi:hypothetical protein